MRMAARKIVMALATPLPLHAMGKSRELGIGQPARNAHAGRGRFGRQKHETMLHHFGTLIQTDVRLNSGTVADLC